MRTVHWLLICLLATVVGGAGGYMLAPQNSAPVTPASNSPVSSDTKQTGSTPAEAPKQRPSNPPPAKPPKPDPPTLPDLEAGQFVAQALRAITPYPRLSGDGVIRGRISDADGSPVAGVKVTAMAHWQNGNDYLVRVWDYEERDLWEGLQEDVTHLVRLRRYHINDDFTAVSNEDGRYELTGLPKSPTMLRINHPGYRFEVLNGQSRHVPSAEVDVIAYRAYPVHVRVVQPDGAEPPAGRLSVVNLESSQQVWPMGQRERTEWSYMLAPGVYSFQASLALLANGYMRRVETDQPVVAIVPSEEVQTITLTYAPEAVLSVAVDDTRFGYAQVQVGCAPDIPGLEPVEVLRSTHIPHLLTHSPVGGTPAEFHNLAPGVYVVGVKLQGLWFACRRVEYTDAGVDCTLQPEPPPESECISCVVTTPRGRALATPSFSIERDGGQRRYPLIAWPAGTLRYLLQLPPGEEFNPNEPGVLKVTDRYRGSAEVGLSTCGPQPVTLTISPTSYLVVKWPDDFGRSSTPVVKLLDMSGILVREERRWHTNQLADGLLVSVLKPGQYRLLLEIDGPHRLAVLETQIELAEGFNQIDLDPPELGSVRVTTTDKEVWRFELVFGEAKQARHLSKDGIVLQNLPPGDYTIRYRKRTETEDREINFTLPGTTEIQLD